MNNQRVALTLRLGLAFVFLYAAIASFLAPENWIGFFPRFLLTIFPGQILLGGFSLTEVAVALWLLSGWRVKWAALLSAAMLTGIVVFNLGAMDIVFRDVGLASAALALFELSHY